MQVYCGGRKRDLGEAIEYCTDERIDAGDMCHQTLIDFRDACQGLTARLSEAEARVTKLTEQLALRLRAEGCDREELLKECIANREKLADAETRIVPVHVIFDGPPSHQFPRFVEVETPTGRGVRLGQWVNKGDGYWALVFNVPIDQTVGYEPATVGKNLETQQEIIDRLSRDGLDVTLPNTNEEV